MDYGSRDAAQAPLSNGTVTGYGAPSPDRNQTMTRAEKFEDEKRRIIGSCFNKTDEKGNLVTSYITHVRVIEDATSPSAPPPLNSAPDNRKPRVIIVAVKITGRVHMYKARENDNGQFQIGKEWDLDQLRQLESFTHAVPVTPEEHQRAQRAGTTGFVVIMAKPYYWQANTAKEKDFFLASLVKIYRKYTQGRVPELLGFDQREIDTMLKVPGQSPPTNTSSPDMARQTPEPPMPPPQARRYDSPGDGYSSQGGQSSRPHLNSQSQGTKAIEGDAAQTQQSQPSTTYDRRYGTGTSTGYPSRPSQDSGFSRNRSPDSARQGFRNDPILKPQISHSNFVRPRSTSPANSNLSSAAPSVQPSVAASSSTTNAEIKSATATALANEPGFFDGTPLSTSTDRRYPKTNGVFQRSIPETSETTWPKQQETTAPPRSIPADVPTSPPPQPLPERKRPPLQDSQLSPTPSSASTSIRNQNDRSAVATVPAEAKSEQTNGDVPKEIPGLQLPARTPPAAQPPQPLASSRTVTPSSDRNLEADRKEELPAPGDVPRTADPPEVNTEPQEERFRPGLGPMVKRTPASDTASKFRKAANAYKAFQPRAGSALNKVLANKMSGNEPDGITGVVPAPLLQREQSQDSVHSGMSEPLASAKSVNVETPKEVPEVTVSSPHGDGAQETISEVTDDKPGSLQVVSQPSEPEAEKPAPVVPPRAPRTRKRKSERYARGLVALDIDPAIFGARGLDFESLLVDVGWNDDDETHVKKVETLEADIRREIAKSEAGAWVGNFDQKDERIDIVGKMLDKAIDECEQLDGLLTLYGVELGTLNDDVAYIEAQSQGLQVQTANQKQLLTELQNLVNTISISPREMEPLRQASLGDLDGLQAIESCLQGLYKALASHHSGSVTSVETDLSNMRALQEKKEMYMRETTSFLDRMLKYMDPTFGAAAMHTKDALTRPKADSLRSDISIHDTGRKSLWKFSPLMLFAKEIDFGVWESLMRVYQSRVKSVYHDEFRNIAITWKARARKASGEEQEALFTAQEKEAEGLTSTARKLTVKRSQTLAKSFRTTSIDRPGSLHRNQDTKRFPWEVFHGIIDVMMPLISNEQNFIIDFFHASSGENMDFNDAVRAAPPSARQGTNLTSSRVPESDRKMANKVLEAMEDVFGFWPTETQTLVDWATKMDVIQGLGILCVVEHKIAELEDTNQDFLVRTLQKLRERLSTMFNRFIDEQIRAIEDTKVKIKKRKGVIAFMKVFPNFSAVIETLIQPFDGPEKMAIRSRIDDAYEKINKAMFDSLKVIAKESPTIMMQSHAQGYGLSGGADPADKEALNYHILLVENMYHYYNEVEERGDEVLGRWRGQAVREMDEHQDLYVSAIIRRPLNKLLEYIESTELLMSMSPGSSNPSIIPTTSPSHSRSVYKKLLAYHDAKEIQSGVRKLRERVEKHLSGADEATISEKLIGVVLGECERRYNSVYDRLEKITREVYEDSLEVGFKREHIAEAFKR